MKTNNKYSNGITLISLVVTIIVLLILSGVALTMLTGENGILKMAKTAREKTIEADEDEKEKLRGVQSLLEGSGGTIEEVKTNGTVTSRLVADGKGGSFYLPVGFYYVGGTVASGVVISDNSLDDGKYLEKTNVGKTDLVGNQYVWIPVDDKKIVFAQHDYSKERWPAGSEYSNYSDWKNKHYTGINISGGYEYEMDSNIASVKKYGGFYIGRYEAGWEPVTIDTTTYTNNKPIGDSKVPESKYGYAPWNHISQIKSSIVCDRLNNKEGYENVKARLIDGYAWDTTVEYIKSAVSSVTISNTYGNYSNSLSKARGVLIGYKIYKTAKNGTGTTGWVYNGIKYRYEPNEITIGARELDENETEDMILADTILTEAGESLDTTNYTYKLYYELTTGGSESTKVKNIYDLAGNMCEWTSEVGGHDILSENNWKYNEQTFGSLRGGSFNNYDLNLSVTYRSGFADVTKSDIDFGFRCVLYVK